MHLLELRNRGEKGAVTASFQHHGETYYMDMNQKQESGACVITYWKKVPGGKRYLCQMERNDVRMSIRWAVTCIKEYCRGLNWRMRT